MQQAPNVPQAPLFSPIFSGKTEKMGPPEAKILRLARAAPDTSSAAERPAAEERFRPGIANAIPGHFARSGQCEEVPLRYNHRTPDYRIFVYPISSSSALAAACLPLAIASTTSDAPDAISPACRTGTPVFFTASYASAAAGSQPEKPDARMSSPQGSVCSVFCSVTPVSAPASSQTRDAISVS